MATRKVATDYNKGLQLFGTQTSVRTPLADTVLLGFPFRTSPQGF